MKIDAPAQGRDPLFGPQRQQFAHPAEDPGVPCSIPLPLGDEPGFEKGDPFGDQPIEELAIDRCRKPFENLHVGSREGRLPVLLDPQRIDGHGGDVDRDVVLVGPHPLAVGVVENGTDLGQAPPQFATRVVGTIPEDLAQPRTVERAASHDEIGQQAAGLAGGWQDRKRRRSCHRHRTQQLHRERRRVLRPSDARNGGRIPLGRGFHTVFNAGFHAAFHARWLEKKSLVAFAAPVAAGLCDRALAAVRDFARSDPSGPRC